MKIATLLLPFSAIVLAACVSDGPAGAASGPPAARATPVAAGASLAASRWIAKVEGIDERNAPRLEFLPEGRIAGYTGCNMLSGTWRREGNEALLGPVITTKRGCLGPEGDAEKRVLAAMGEGSRLEVSGDKLVIVGRRGGRFELQRVQ